MIADVIAETDNRLRALGARSVADVRAAANPVAAFSAAMADSDRTIKGFLYPRMYRHPRVSRIMGQAEEVVADLFERYLSKPHDMPGERHHGADDGAGHLRAIADFIAGMTDRYALIEHARLFDTTPELR
jgi:dGTPase